MFILGLTKVQIIYIAIFIIILVNLACILYLVFKERRKDREEIEEIVSSLAKAKPREEKVVVEEIKEVPKPTLEIGALLEKMQKDLEATPEEVVTNFEKDQEEKSIISYQELVKSLKRDMPVKEEIKQELTREIEEKKVKIEEKEPVDVIDIEEEISVKQVEQVPEFKKIEELAEEKVKETPKKKFKNTDFISPIFGKMNATETDYPVVHQFSREEKLEELLEDVPARHGIIAEVEEALDVEPLHNEIRKNDEFLKSLKDFRSNL